MTGVLYAYLLTEEYLKKVSATAISQKFRGESNILVKYKFSYLRQSTVLVRCRFQIRSPHGSDLDGI